MKRTLNLSDYNYLRIYIFINTQLSKIFTDDFTKYIFIVCVLNEKTSYLRKIYFIFTFYVTVQ